MASMPIAPPATCAMFKLLSVSPSAACANLGITKPPTCPTSSNSSETWNSQAGTHKRRSALKRLRNPSISSANRRVTPEDVFGPGVSTIFSGTGVRSHMNKRQPMPIRKTAAAR